MSEFDLPEPIRPSLTPKENEERLLRLFTTLFIFISAYACLHKVLIPFCLSFTKLHPSPYTVIDFWFVHPVLVAVLFYKEKGNSKSFSFLAGAAVTYGVLEVLEVIQGHYIGWLSFSRLLSSSPMALLSLFTITRKFHSGSALLGWMGALFLLPIFYGNFLFPVANSAYTELKNGETLKEVSRTLPIQEPPVCGASQLSITKEGLSFQTTDTLEVRECGITPSFIRLSSAEISLVNNGKTALNLHMGYYKKNKVVTGWNVLLPPGQSVKRPVIVQEDSLAVIYSDSLPDAGIAAVISQPVKSNWDVTRKPLMIREHQ